MTCDANNNITELKEATIDEEEEVAVFYTNFYYDWANRLTEHRTRCVSARPAETLSQRSARLSCGSRSACPQDTQRTQRVHEYDAVGRLVKSGWRQYWESGEVPQYAETEHTYAGSRHIQNYDGSSTYGERWHWAGAQHAHSSPVKSSSADTASQAGFNLANDRTPQRRTFLTPTSEGDERHLKGQGKSLAKDCSGSGANWCTAQISQGEDAVASRFGYEGTVSSTDMDRVTDSREKGRIGIFGTTQSYAGSSGRVTHELIGRDLNPLGRGDGNALVGGTMNLGHIKPILPGSIVQPAVGSSVNNCGYGGSGYPGSETPDDPGGLPDLPPPPQSEPDDPGNDDGSGGNYCPCEKGGCSKRNHAMDCGEAKCNAECYGKMRKDCNYDCICCLTSQKQIRDREVNCIKGGFYSGGAYSSGGWGSLPIGGGSSCPGCGGWGGEGPARPLSAGPWRPPGGWIMSPWGLAIPLGGGGFGGFDWPKPNVDPRYVQTQAYAYATSSNRLEYCCKMCMAYWGVCTELECCLLAQIVEKNKDDYDTKTNPNLARIGLIGGGLAIIAAILGLVTGAWILAAGTILLAMLYWLLQNDKGWGFPS